MKIEKYIWNFFYCCEELVLHEIRNPSLWPTSTELLQISPAPFDFFHSSRNVELFLIILRAEPEILEETRSGNMSVFENFLG